jgi:putative spermidine/putrescine transport system ATP-binding protein
VTADLELERVTKRYGDVAAVRDVSFRVEPGEFVTLLGPSGGGKTSTLRIVAGFLVPDEGRVLLRGERVDTVPPYERDIGMVFQNYALFPHMTVFDNVAFGLRMRRLARREIAPRVDEALALVRLEGYGARHPHQLSGGQQQRVAIARALVVRPSLLLLDEPLSNLDAALRASMQLELRNIVERVGVTTLYVTHHQEEALSMSDRIIVMAQGAIEQSGPPAEVYRTPRSEFVARFLGRSNLLRGRVRSLAGGLVTVDTDTGLPVSVAGLEAAAGESVVLLVRPEVVEITAPGRPGANCFEGVVSQAAYMGAFVEYVVDAAGHALLVHAPASTEWKRGDKVTVSWDPRLAAPVRDTTKAQG